MPEVVPQADRLDQILVQSERARDTARDSRRLERVREARAEMIVRGVDPDLGLVAKAPERLRVHDPVAVPLERRPQAAGFLLTRAPARLIGTDCEQREPPVLVLAHAKLEGVGDRGACSASAQCPQIPEISRTWLRALKRSAFSIPPTKLE